MLWLWMVVSELWFDCAIDGSLLIWMGGFETGSSAFFCGEWGRAVLRFDGGFRLTTISTVSSNTGVEFDTVFKVFKKILQLTRSYDSNISLNQRYSNIFRRHIFIFKYLNITYIFLFKDKYCETEDFKKSVYSKPFCFFFHKLLLNIYLSTLRLNFSHF